MASVLRDLGGGMIGALTTADPRYGVAEAVIDGPAIRYVGAQSTACSANPDLPQTAYRANPATIASDAYAASTGNSVFQALKGSAIGTGTALQYRHCTIERRVTVLKPGAEDIISRGPQAAIQRSRTDRPSISDGLAADNSLAKLHAHRLSDDAACQRPGRIVDAPHAVLRRRLGTGARRWQLVGSGPSPWTTLGLPPSNASSRRHSIPIPIST
jgi:hypothetical protein